MGRRSGRADPWSAYLPQYLETRRWFLAKRRRVRSVAIHDSRCRFAPGYGYIIIVRIDYNEGEHDLYALPLALATGEKAEQVIRRNQPDLVLADVLACAMARAVLCYGALWDEEFNNSLARSNRAPPQIPRRTRGTLGMAHCGLSFTLGPPASESEPVAAFPLSAAILQSRSAIAS